MSLITATDLSKSYHPVDIFSGISLSIPGGGRIAIVGPNGIGKSTLLRILLGIEEPSGGSVQRKRHLKTGYLPQEAGLSGNHTLWQECLTALPDLLAASGCRLHGWLRTSRVQRPFITALPS